jgi:hypothetical protein
MPKRMYLSLGSFAFLLIVLALPSFACETYPSPQDGFYTYFRGGTGFQLPFNEELGDYGLIFEDAKSRDCDGGSWLAVDGQKHGAYEALLNKINTTINRTHTDFQGQTVGPYQGWLEGGFVTLIFSTALMIGGHGDLDTTLDNALQQVELSYSPASGTCGFSHPSGWLNGGDTCMEEHAAAASAYGWMAAYESKRGRYWNALSYGSQARSQIALALSTEDSICISAKPDPSHPEIPAWDPNGRGPCNINTNDLNTLQSYLLPDANGITKGDILSFNRDENIVYGLGQMTQISSALIALGEAGYDDSLTPQQQVIAIGLLDEGQRKAEGSSGAWFWFGNCARATIVNGAVVREDSYGCSDTPPRAFVVNTRSWRDGWRSVFENYVTMYTPRASTVDHRVLSGSDTYTTVNPAYQFNIFDPNLFSRSVSGGLNWGRESIYKVLGWTWNTIDNNRYANNTWYPAGDDRRPRLWAYLDNNNPQGYLDGIDANGVAWGWTCDSDLPDWSNSVDFYIDGGGLGQFVMRAQANQGSEQAVANLCGGGYAHRFSVQLPSWTQGHYVYAWGLDATWRGVNVLPGWQCASTWPACVW